MCPTRDPGPGPETVTWYDGYSTFDEWAGANTPARNIFQNLGKAGGLALQGAIRGDIRDPPRSGATPGDLHAIPSDPPRSDAAPAVRSKAAPVIMVYAKIEVSDRLPPARENS